MVEAELELALRDLEQTGTLVKDRPYRQVWRFLAENQSYFLKFYPRTGKALKRLIRGDPAMRELVRLQWLQKAGVPSPRGVAVLKGFKIGGRTGDAVILEAIEEATSLDEICHEAELRGERIAGRYDLANQVIDIVARLARAKLSHSDLHLGNFLCSQGRLYLIDAYAVRSGGFRLKDLLFLAHAANRYSTRQEMVRGWLALGPGGMEIPRRNKISGTLWRKTAQRGMAKNRYCARIRAGEWDGWVFRSWRIPFNWSRVNRMSFEKSDWEQAWREILCQIENGNARVMKNSASGDVFGVSAQVGEQMLDLVVKRPKRKQWHRWLTDSFRGDRALRAWKRSWDMIARGIPTAWPVMVMRRSRFGYPMESYIVFERVEGSPLAQVDLDQYSGQERETLFRRVGRLLRRIDETGFYHRDAKSDNIMITPAGRPVLVDLDGVRKLTFGRWSLPRLLKSMKLHKQYTPADSLALCQGYAPFTKIAQEQVDNGSSRSEM